MSVTPHDRINACMTRVADLRQRANASPDPFWKAELRDLEAQWRTILESYQLVEKTGRLLTDIRTRRGAETEKVAQRESEGLHPERPTPAHDVPLAGLLDVLVRVAVEHAGGNARAGFFLADAAGVELHHVVGMPQAYAKCVDGFAISKTSLGCGLAVATQQPIITPDVSRDPRWQEWQWLAKAFDYRACWSFPIVTTAGKALGAFAMYYAEPREPAARDLELAAVITRVAAFIIMRR